MIVHLLHRLTDYCTRVRDPPQNGHHHHELKARDVEVCFSATLVLCIGSVIMVFSEHDSVGVIITIQFSPILRILPAK